MAAEASSTAPGQKRQRRWPWIVGLVVALVAGIGVGAASQKSEIDDLTKQRDVAVAQVHDRESQRRANLAKVAAQKAEVARAKHEAEVKAAADQAVQQQQLQKALDDAAKKAAAMNTIDGDGVYAIGTDKNPGRYHTDGNINCYYAVLNTPDTGDIATNDNVNGPAYVDLPAGKYFETTRCATWTKVG